MATNTITFQTNSAQNAKIKEAMEWRADRKDPDNAPHTLDAAGIAAQVRQIALQFIKSETKSELADKRRANKSADDHVDGIT